VSPDEIDEVTRSWRRAMEDPQALRNAIAARLAGPPAFRAERAGWIVRAVSSLGPVLSRPTTFAPAAAELIALRFPVTLDELAVERDALLGGLAECCGPPSPAAERAWDLAFGLFAEIVCATGLDPFATPAPAAAPAPSTPPPPGESEPVP
jgi:hypothetical protein